MTPSLKTLLSACLIAAIVPGTIASANFKDAQQYIDLDGSLMGYIDFEGDGEYIGTALNEIYREVQLNNLALAFLPLDFNHLIDSLGFGSVKAFALSSKNVEPGLYRNRSVTLMQGEGTGLFDLSGTEASTFTAAKLAPGDATAALTVNIQLGSLKETAVALLQPMMGPAAETFVAEYLAEAIPSTNISYAEALDLLSGQWDGYWRQSGADLFENDVRFWLQLENAGELLHRVRPLVEEMGVSFVEDAGRMVADFSNLMGDEAPFALFLESAEDGGPLLIYTDPEWTAASVGAALTDQAAFQNLAGRLPESAVSFYYDAGTDIEHLLEMLEAFPAAAPYKTAVEKAVDLLVGGFLEPSMAVTYLDGDHWVSDAYAGYSTKRVVMTIPAAFAIGIGSAAAIPAFNQVRTQSQEATVRNNLRMIASAADQYFLENGVTEVHIDELIGEGGYIRELKPVAGESYEGMAIKAGEPIRVTLGDGTEMVIAF